MISKEQLHQIMPRASAETLEKYCQPLNDTMDRYKINTPQRMACFLAQLAHESAQLSATRENLNYSESMLLTLFKKYFTPEQAKEYAHKPERIANRVYANRYGNRDEASGDGWKYRGGGPMQITFPDNYKACGAAIGADLLNHPELIEGAVYGALSAGWFWDFRKLNDLADVLAFIPITKKINGGTNGLEDRLKYFALAKKTLGI